MERNDSSILSASNINEIVFQLEHNTILGSIVEAKERFWDVVIIDMLINNNDRNEDNWGVIKFKKENKYKLAPIYDCGNCFYGKTSEERIQSIMSDHEKLQSSAINGITAYEDDEEKRISSRDILKINNSVLKERIKYVSTLIDEKISLIENFINSIPNSYGDIDIMSEERKAYYIETLRIRIDKILKKLQ